MRRMTDILGNPLFRADHTFRLEPIPRSNEVASGLAARIHDPAWLLTRQWQFGEFAGQDAGSPVVVSIAGRSERISAWRPLPEEGPVPGWRRYRVDDGPLDTRIEAEHPPSQPDLRTRVDGGTQLVAMLREAGKGVHVKALVAACRFAALPRDTPELLRLTAQRVPDPLLVVAGLQKGTLQVAAGSRPVLTRWSKWWVTTVGRPGPDTFNPHRFEHRFELSCGEDVLRAEEYLGDRLDWDVVDKVPGTAARPAAAFTFRKESLATPVRYGGLPADRFWEMEDAQVDLSAAEVSTLDTGRLLVIGFSEVYGNDWFLVPLEIPVGSLTQLTKVVVLDTFGDRWLVERAGRADSGWNLFSVTGKDDGLLIMPTAFSENGAALETVALARDELANTAWAIEQTVSGPARQLVDRREAWLRIRPEPPEPGALPAYAVQTVVPNYWLPLIPEATGPETIRFRLTRLLQPHLPDADAEPRGRLLPTGEWIHEEEVPREGAQLTRRPVLARWYDGSWHTWTRREKNAGSGESSSGLTFDLVRPSDPWP
jgi:hypothetical protein